ncbi:MAG: DUF6020 family protein [Bacteroidales bacterium]
MGIKPDEYPGLYEITPLFSREKSGLSFLLKLPVIGWFVSPGFLMLIFLTCFYELVFRTDKKWLAIFMPTLLSFLILFISPENGCYRYVMPIAMILPFFIANTVKQN